MACLGVPVCVGNVRCTLVYERHKPAPCTALCCGGRRRGGLQGDPGQELFCTHTHTHTPTKLSPRATLRWGPGTVLLVVIYCG